MRKLALSFIAIFLLTASTTIAAKNVAYINLSPDKRYSENGDDSIIAFVTDKQLYGYGHEMGVTKDCSTREYQCLSFSFMAVLSLPVDIEVGDQIEVPGYSFRVSKKKELTLLGCTYEIYRVEVENSGKFSNSYYFSKELGVVAIGVPTFDDGNIKELIFLLRDRNGLFHPGEKTGTPTGSSP